MFQFALRCISDLFRMIEGYLRHIEGSFGAFVFFVSSSMWTDAACNGRNPQRCSWHSHWDVRHDHDSIDSTRTVSCCRQLQIPQVPRTTLRIFQSKIWKRHFGKVLPFFIWKWSLRRMPGATTSAKRLQFAGAFPSTLMLHVCLQCIQLEHKPRFCPGMTLMSPVSRGFLILASLASASHRFIRARDPC